MKFTRVNKVSNGVIYVGTKIGTNEGPIIEEDYTDLNDVYKELDESYRNELINSIRKVEIIHRS